MNSNIGEQLQSSFIFRGVEPAGREALVAVMHREHFPQGVVLFHKDSVGDSVYLILSGEIRIYSVDEIGREFTIRHYGANQIFGEFAMLDQKPRSASAAASQDSDVLILHRDDFLNFLRERPLLGLSLMQNLVERVRYTTNYLQRVMDATQLLTRGEYEQAALSEIPGTAAETEIQKLVDAFVQMVRSVQLREETLRRGS